MGVFLCVKKVHRQTHFILGDVINTVLSIYMMGEGQPLPQSDEVLVCNTDTTLDEVSYHQYFISSAFLVC